MKLRYARHTNGLSKISEFYQNVLELKVSGSFQDHNGYSGVFLTTPKSAWELEFTQNSRKTEHFSDPDDALVFYSETNEEWSRKREHLSQLGIALIDNPNPYWNKNGLCFLDPDGFTVIIARPRTI